MDQCQRFKRLPSQTASALPTLQFPRVKRAPLPNMVPQQTMRCVVGPSNPRKFQGGKENAPGYSRFGEVEERYTEPERAETQQQVQ